MPNYNSICVSLFWYSLVETVHFSLLSVWFPRKRKKKKNEEIPKNQTSMYYIFLHLSIFSQTKRRIIVYFLSNSDFLPLFGLEIYKLTTLKSISILIFICVCVCVCVCFTCYNFFVQCTHQKAWLVNCLFGS